LRCISLMLMVARAVPDGEVEMRIDFEGPMADIREFHDQLDEAQLASSFEIGAVAEKTVNLFEHPALRYDPWMEFFIASSAGVTAGAAEGVAKKIMEKAKNWPKIRVKISVEKPEKKEPEHKSAEDSNQ
jgi:hypothetical protein